jgi:GNAT superfamily N-acetyltransferase
MADELARLLAETYRWQRRLGNQVIATPHCSIVANPAHPEVWEANHAEEVTAKTEAKINAVLAAMDRYLAHTPWRIAHTDCFIPDAFLARLALDDFDERFVVIQMALRGGLADCGASVTLRPVVNSADWDELLRLVMANHAERRHVDGLDLPPAFSAAIVDIYRAKSDAYHFHLAIKDRVPVAYGGRAAAPNGAGMIEDLFTLPSARRQGIITNMIAAFANQLRADGCHTIFLGALANDRPKRLYARLGFHPVTLARTWVRKLADQGE